MGQDPGNGEDEGGDGGVDVGQGGHVGRQRSAATSDTSEEIMVWEKGKEKKLICSKVLIKDGADEYLQINFFGY